MKRESEPETAPTDAGDLGKSGKDIVPWDGVSAAEMKDWPVDLTVRRSSVAWARAGLEEWWEERPDWRGFKRRERTAPSNVEKYGIDGLGSRLCHLSAVTCEVDSPTPLTFGFIS